MRSTPVLSVLASLLPAVVLVIATGASAAMTPADAHRELQKLHGDISEVYKLLPTSYGLDPGKEETQVQKAQVKLKETKAKFDPSLQAAPQAYSAVKTGLEKVEKAVQGSQLAVACSRSEYAVRAEHKRGVPASDQEMKALQTAVASLEAFGAPYTDVARHFGSRLDALRVDRQALLLKQKEAETERLAEQRKKDLENAMRAANRVRREADRLLAAQTPLPQDLIRSLTATANKVHSLDAGAGAYYLGEVRRYERASGWLMEDPQEGLGIVAGVLEGDPIDAGTTTRKRLNLRFDAKKGTCFAVFLRYQKLGNGLLVDDYEMTFSQGTIQRFDVPSRGVGYQRIDGGCALEDTKVKVSGKATPTGKNPLRYLVLSWDRKKLPTELVSEMSLRAPDPCDPAAWRAAWYTPVPGTLVYKDDRPFLVVKADGAGEEGVTLLGPATDTPVTATKSALMAAPPKSPNVDLKFDVRACPVPSEDSKGDRLALYKCHARIDKKFSRNLARAERKVDRARSDKSRERAEKALDKLKTKVATTREKTCGPLAENLRQKAKLVVDEILDRYATNPPQDVIDRAALLRGNLAARPELR